MDGVRVGTTARPGVPQVRSAGKRWRGGWEAGVRPQKTPWMSVVAGRTRAPAIMRRAQPGRALWE